MVEIKAEINPVRLKFGKDKKVELLIQLTNDANKERTISCDIILTKNLSFEKNGLSSTKSLKLGEIKSGEKKSKYLDIYSKMTLTKQEQPIQISVIEHFEKNYNYILSKKTKTLYLRIE